MSDSPPSQNDNSLAFGFDLQDIFDNAPVGIFTSTPEGRYISVNSTMARMHGYGSPEEMMESVTDIAAQVYVDPADRLTFQRLLEENNEAINHECRFHRQDGSVFWVSRNARAVRNQDGHIIAYQGFATDISDRKRSELKERESEERFRLMFMNAPMPYQSLDEQGNFLDVNQTFLDVLGYAREELIGKNFGDYLHPDWRDHFKKNFPRFKAVGEILGVEFEMVKKDGSTILVYFNGKIQRDDQGRFVRTHCIFQDITDRKRAEEALRESERNYRVLVEGLPDIILRFDRMGRHLFASPNVELVTGIPWVEFFGKTHRELGFAEHMCAYWEEMIGKVFDLGEELETEFEHHAKDRTIIFNWRLIPERGDTGIQSVLSFSRDITRTKLAENALRESERKYRELSGLLRLMCDNVPDMIWAKNLEKKYIFANTAICRNLLNAADTEEPIGKTDLHFAKRERNRYPDNPEWHTFGEICRDTDQITMDARIPKQFDEYGNVQGKFLFLDVHKAPFIDEHGNMIGTVGSARDVTEYKRAEEALRQNMIRYKAVFENVPVGIVTYDRQGTILDCNATFITLIGSSREALIGVNALKLPDENIARTLRGSLEGKVSIYEGTYRAYTSEKSTMARMVCAPLLSDDREVAGGVAIVEDIAERKNAEETIRQINQQLQLANAEKDKLFSIIAHDLRSPISGLLTSTEMLADDMNMFSKKDTQTILKELHKSTKNVFELMEDLLQWSRMSQGSMDYSPAPCSLDELINTSLHSAQDVAKHKDIAIRLDIPRGVSVFIDQSMINAVIRNLLFNAVKFSHRGGTIVITAQQTGPTVTIAIQDNGIGMDAQLLSRIFSVEKKKRQLGTEGEKGTGLGLMLCREFIEKHGGRIWIESEQGKKTTVFFTLPTAADGI